MQTAFREMHTSSGKAAANCRVPWEHLSGLSSSGYIQPLRTPTGASLVVQWLRIHLAIQGTLVRSLVQEDPTCCRTTKTAPQLLSQSSRAREPKRRSPCPTNTEAHMPTACALQQEKPLPWRGFSFRFCHQVSQKNDIISLSFTFSIWEIGPQDI